MDLLYLTGLMIALAAPFHWAVMRELRRLDSPEYLRQVGVIVLRPEALDATDGAIGTYGGTTIFRAVRFKGIRYEFVGVVPRDYRSHIHANELYMDPGLLYLTRDAS